MKFANKWFIFLLAGSLFLSCGKDNADSGDPNPEPEIPNTHEDAAANRWIYEEMSKQYLYNSHTKQITPDYNQSCETFFNSLLSSSPADNDGKHPDRNGRNYFYSYMERTPNLKSIGMSTTYGIEYIIYTEVDENETPTGNYQARVLYLTLNSVAEKAGVKRGDWIHKIDKKPITENNLHLLDHGPQATFTIERQDIENLQDGPYYEDITLSAATEVENSPVFLDTVIVKGPNKIGYLVYNEFEMGTETSPSKYDDELKAAFQRLKGKGANSLVLDLRYNPGGYLSSCILLCSMITQEGNLGKLFMTYSYNADLNAIRGKETKNLLSAESVSGSNLNLNKLYVLTGNWTASSSEAVINSLRGYDNMTVQIIGTQTEGKNVGSYEINSKKHQLHLQPITLQNFNAKGRSDFAQGFKPNIAADDLSNMDQMFPLGDEREYLLSLAIADITGSPVAKRPAVRSAATRSLRVTDKSSLNRPRTKGLIVTAPEM